MAARARCAPHRLLHARARFFRSSSAPQPVASHSTPLAQIYPQPGWCEHDPMAIWCAGCAACITPARVQRRAVCNALGRPLALVTYMHGHTRIARRLAVKECLSNALKVRGATSARHACPNARPAARRTARVMHAPRMRTGGRGAHWAREHPLPGPGHAARDHRGVVRGGRGGGGGGAARVPGSGAPPPLAPQQALLNALPAGPAGPRLRACRCTTPLCGWTRARASCAAALRRRSAARWARRGGARAQHVGACAMQQGGHACTTALALLLRAGVLPPRDWPANLHVLQRVQDHVVGAWAARFAASGTACGVARHVLPSPSSHVLPSPSSFLLQA